MQRLCVLKKASGCITPEVAERCGNISKAFKTVERGSLRNDCFRDLDLLPYSKTNAFEDKRI
ncbi:MAG: hypothetical protein CBE00_01580 [Planctomycetaceae bacterium TMED240]|nr:hypothetical protein [Rhodopirellula sp.]OUX08517.1 MAG: hypothetical protein CBE00_01580 [Planctomycetaceae bacterium TMED240]